MRNLADQHGFGMREERKELRTLWSWHETISPAIAVIADSNDGMTCSYSSSADNSLNGLIKRVQKLEVGFITMGQELSALRHLASGNCSMEYFREPNCSVPRGSDVFF
eukprot:Skav201872  [mRNA]  locus=scaffold793:56504:57209:- [translate_table: standard]